tara:strand:- start:25 stop:297 length:273 start_codon:yes stop_codon:yes gene_type:complete
MNIYKMAYVNRKGRQIGEVINYDTLDGVSTLLWEEDIDHEVRLDGNGGDMDELQIGVEEGTLMKLIENHIITADEYQELYHNEVDFIILI